MCISKASLFILIFATDGRIDNVGRIGMAMRVIVTWTDNCNLLDNSCADDFRSQGVSLLNWAATGMLLITWRSQSTAIHRKTKEGDGYMIHFVRKIILEMRVKERKCDTKMPDSISLYFRSVPAFYKLRLVLVACWCSTLEVERPLNSTRYFI